MGQGIQCRLAFRTQMAHHIDWESCRRYSACAETSKRLNKQNTAKLRDRIRLEGLPSVGEAGLLDEGDRRSSMLDPVMVRCPARIPRCHQDVT